MSDVVVVQIRHPDDPMGEHERRCFAARLEGHKIRFHNVFEEVPQSAWLDGARALVIGGSGKISVHDSICTPWLTKLRHTMESALEAELATLGICFGHQLLGLHLGAKVKADGSGHERGTVEIHLTQAGQKDPLWASYGASLRVNTGHLEHVEDTPSRLEILGHNQAVACQIFRVKGYPFYSTQFHPELRAGEAIERYQAFAAAHGDTLMASIHEDLRAFCPVRESPENLLADFVSQA